MEGEVPEVASSRLARLGLAWFERAHGPVAANLARVVSAHRGEWDVVDAAGPARAIHCFSETAPVVGDWVLLEAAGAGKRAIREVLPRRGVLRRKAAGRPIRVQPGGRAGTSAERSQIVAAHVDVAFVLLPLDVEPNPRLVERYLALVHDAGVEPVVVLTKQDLVEPALAAERLAQSGAGELPSLTISSRAGTGLGELERYLEEDRTVALLGPSGAGKSTLLNALIGEQRQLTQSVLDNGKGRHTTTRRDLFVRTQGGIVIDTPGMRELGLIDADAGIREAFADISALASLCRFRDCQHRNEPGCALRAAVASGAIERARFENFLALAAGGASGRPARNRAR